MKSAMLIGMIAEKQFAIDAMLRNLLVSIPSHDHNGYDVILESRSKKLYKIQIKCIGSQDRSNRAHYSYKTNLGKGTTGKNKYDKNEVDFFAVYILELKQWYIIPRAVSESTSLRLHPNKKDHKYSQYLEAWHLFK